MEKRLLMIYKSTKNCPPDPPIVINDVQVPQIHEIIHLCYKLSEDIYKFSSTKCVEDFNRQSNIFLANFKHANSNIRKCLISELLHVFYGSQILRLFGKCMVNIYIAWSLAGSMENS